MFLNVAQITEVEVKMELNQAKESQWVQAQLAQGYEKIDCTKCDGAKGEWIDSCPVCYGLGYFGSRHDRGPIEHCQNCSGGRVSEAYYVPCEMCRERGYILYDKGRVSEELQAQSVKKIIFVILWLLLVGIAVIDGGLIVYGIVNFAFEYILLSILTVLPGVPLIILIEKAEPQPEKLLIESHIIHPPEGVLRPHMTINGPASIHCFERTSELARVLFIENIPGWGANVLSGQSVRIPSAIIIMVHGASQQIVPNGTVKYYDSDADLKAAEQESLRAKVVNRFTKQFIK